MRPGCRSPRLRRIRRFSSPFSKGGYRGIFYCDTVHKIPPGPPLKKGGEVKVDNYTDILYIRRGAVQYHFQE